MHSLQEDYMKKGMKLAEGLALCLLTAAAFTGCGTKKSGSTQAGTLEKARYTLNPETPAWKLDPEKDAKLTWYVNAEWWNTGWGEDVVTKKVKEDLNLDVVFLTGDDTKLNTFFAGGDIPDIITTFNASSPMAQKAPSWAYSLQDLADAYDPYFYKVASKETLNWFKLSNGKTYGYPDYSNTQKDYDSNMIYARTAFVIRKDVWTALGKPQMKTQQEFLAVLNKIKAAYPDMIPLGFNAPGGGTGSLAEPLQDFLGVPLVTKDGSFYDRNLDPDYLSWIKTFNTAYKNGCISDDSFTDDGTAFQEKLSIGKYACVLVDGTPQMSGFFTTFANSEPDAAYTAIDGPQSTTGNKPKLGQAGISGWMITYISKKCKDPAKAIQAFTYLLSDEGQILCNYGIKGQTYTINEEGKYELTPEMKKLQSQDNDRFKKEIRIGEFIPFGHDRYKVLSDDAFPDSIKQMQEWGKGKLYPHFILENTDPDAGTPEARANSAIATNWATTLVGLIRAKDDAQFTSITDKYRQFLTENDWDAIVKIRNGKIAENKKKLGIQ
jgi:putative aldouronate transport system substrate-binding protein